MEQDLEKLRMTSILDRRRKKAGFVLESFLPTLGKSYFFGPVCQFGPITF